MTDAAIDPVKLDKLAEVIVRVGLNVQPGQDVVLTASSAALPLVRRVVAAAYRVGAGVVTPLISDDAVTLALYEHGQDASFDRAPGWLYDGMAAAFAAGAARLAIKGDDPMLLAAQDPARVARQGKANSIASKPAMQHITGFSINWNVVAYPSAPWAALVFPDLPPEEAVRRLSEAVFEASRVNFDDPVAEWTRHSAELRTRTEWLNAQRFDALQYTGPGTDLRLGLADGHAWHGGSSTARNGVVCNPNIPTEEVFTTPHARKVDGTVRASKPLAHQGNVIDGIEVRFEAGRIVEAKASSGEAVFKELIATDEGAARLGEVALVPHSSPISQTGLLFFNTLYDENAASHIALGQCYTECFEQTDISEEEVARQGGNSSLIHVDWMIGSDQMDIDGIKPDGSTVPVMRKGEWAQAL